MVATVKRLIRDSVTLKASLMSCALICAKTKSNLFDVMCVNYISVEYKRNTQKC